ncbi:MAG: hypothetical protein ACFFA5_05480 [Promethearchaeota archaeon]
MALDISQWEHYNKTPIKKMICKNALFLKDSNDKPYGIVTIKDWKRILGVNLGYQVARLQELVKKEGIDIRNLKFILVGKMGFSDSIERFADKQKIELKSEASMCYEYPALREFVRKSKGSMEKEIQEEEPEDNDTLSEDNIEDLYFSYRKDTEKESFLD